MQKVTIKKNPNKNEYLLTQDGVWVRDFCKPAVPKIDINLLTQPSDFPIFVGNEIENNKKKFMELDAVAMQRSKIIIVSDGYDFENRQKMLSRLPKDVTIIGVNKALRKWELVGDNCPEKDKKAMAFYVVNNPYQEAVSFLPKKTYYPKCITSIRTNTEFIKSYKGPMYVYSPVRETRYGGTTQPKAIVLDDYRNPICAAIGASFFLNATKVMLFSCDNSFSDFRDGAEKLENGLWQYPQHAISQRIIDGNLYWLQKNGIQVASYSSGSKFENATYINDETGMLRFFEE